MGKAICQSNVDLDERLLLGYLFFYNLGEIKISENDLEAIFVKNIMPRSFIKKINKADAFRRASAKSKATININYNGSLKKARLEVDEVKTNPDGILRLLGRKLIDEKNEALSYESVGKIIFNRKTESVITEVDPKFLGEFDYSQVLAESNFRYQDFIKFHTRDTIRNITNSILEDMYPVNLMPSGLAKFIPKSNKDSLYALQGVIRDLKAFGTDCLFEIVPIIDTDEQRKIIRRAAEREVDEDLFNFTQELKEVLNDKKAITSRSAVSYIDKFKSLEIKVNAYESLLGNYMDALKHQLVQAIKFVEVNTETDKVAM